MKYVRRTFAIAVIVMGIMVPMKIASSQGLPPGQLPTLTAEWWQWAFSIPASLDQSINTNPLFDNNGADCMVGQRGSVWFLAGNLTGASAPITRTCSVPGDKTLFFPVINASFFNSPNQCGQGSESFTVSQMRQAVKEFIDSASDIMVIVDGSNVKKTLLRRVQSDVFDIAVPTNNLYKALGIPCDAGVYSPTVDDGYYVALGPLAAGNHTIEFHAAAGTFAQTFTYNLTVVPVALK